MSRTLTEATVFQSVQETALGTPAATGWRTHRPNEIGAFGAAFKTIQADPIGAGRQLQAGEIVDLEAPTEWSADLSKDLVDHFVEGIMMAAVKHSGNTGLAFFNPTAVTATGYTVAALGALTDRHLIYARGFSTAANNGLKITAGASVALEIKAAGLVAEAAPPAGVSVEVAGWRGAAGDIGINAAGNLTSTANVFATLGLYVGQWIWLGGSAALNQFANNAYRGFAQVKAIAAGVLTLQRRSWTVGAQDLGAAKEIDIYFSRWCRNTNSQHADYIERSFTFETTYATLGAGSTPEYEYSHGNYLSTATFNLPPTDKATVDLAFVGAFTTDPAAARLAGANAAPPMRAGAILNTSVGMTRIRCSNADESGLSTDIKTLKIELSNSVNREVVLGYLGAKYQNVGQFSAMIEGDFLFTSSALITAMRDKRTVMFEVGMRNGDGGFLIDVPSAQVDSGGRRFDANASVVVPAKLIGSENPVMGYTAGISIFPYLPAS